MLNCEDYHDEQTCKNHNLLLVTEHSNQKANGKILIGFCQVTQGDASLWAGQQTSINTAALY